MMEGRSGPDDSVGADSLSRPALTQLVYELGWELRTRRRRGEEVRLSDYEAALGAAVFARPEVGGYLRESDDAARREAAGTAHHAVVLGQALRTGEIDPYPYIHRGDRPGEVGRFAHFRVVREIGRGGMAVVFEAVDDEEQLTTAYALKVLPTALDTPKARERLLSEANNQNRITDLENVVKVLSAKEVATPDGGSVAYIAMEFVYGPTLQQLIDHFRARDVTASIELGSDLIRQAACGLAAAHRKDIAHRDVKPGNLLLQCVAGGESEPLRWRVRVCDFGLAAAAGQSRLTTAGRVFGTPGYLAPEQLEGRGADTRSDVFALGTMFYELITGRHPFLDPEGKWDVYASQLAAANPVFPRERTPTIPAGVEQLTMRMLARNPEARPLMADVAKELLKPIRWTDAPTPVLLREPDIDQAYESYRAAVIAGFTVFDPEKPPPDLDDPDPDAPLPFLETQPMYSLNPDRPAKRALHDEKIRGARPFGPKGYPSDPRCRGWALLSRPAFIASFATGSGHRVAVTTDAGLGKTRNLAWIVRECLHYRQGWAFFLTAGEVTRLDTLVADHLVPRVLRATVAGGGRARLAAHLDAARAAGQITLVVDGLDQWQPVPADTRAGHWLADLLAPGAGWNLCTVILAGRPYALDAHWTELFAGRSDHWQFVRLGGMNEEQQEQLLGKRRYDAVSTEARDLLSTPRVLEYVRGLRADQLPSLRTVADVYWQAIEYQLVRAAEKSSNRAIPHADRRRFLQVLGALAFSMYAETWADRRGIIWPNLDRIEAGDRLLDFLYGSQRGKPSVLDRLRGVIPDYSRQAFDADLLSLSALNLTMNHGWLDADARPLDRQPLLWRNASLQEFLAAYWVSLWGSSDATRIHDWVAASIDHKHGLRTMSPAFYWFWRYAVEMPNQVIWPDVRKPPSEAWVAAMTPLWVSPLDKQGHPIRSPEFLYRCWIRAGDPFGHSKAGRVARDRFLAEFQRILNEFGSHKQRVAVAMLADGAFKLLVGSGKDGDTGTFWMGSESESCADSDNPAHPVTLSEFALHQFCVTNAEYELFDPSHKLIRLRVCLDYWKKRNDFRGSEDNCPVVNVSWYDSWCFARWVGAVQLRKGGPAYKVCLPSEAQWEYACRAGQETAFTFGELHPGSSITPDVCNFRGRAVWPADTKLPIMKEEDVWRRRVVPVGALGPNRWGFYQMHGNVYEWCEDWYRSDFYSSDEARLENPECTTPGEGRVMRGGWFFTSSGEDCRSAKRNWLEPGSVMLPVWMGVGIRLAATPVTKAEMATLLTSSSLADTRSGDLLSRIAGSWRRICKCLRLSRSILAKLPPRGS